MKTAWFIGNRKTISSLPWWRQWLVRLALWLANWTCSDEIHGNMITFTEDRAIELASRDGWFKLELPVDSELPEEAVNFGNNDEQFPLSEQTFIYHHSQVLETIPAENFRLLQEGVARLKDARQAATG
jgi:hypothetical protein